MKPTNDALKLYLHLEKIAREAMAEMAEIKKACLKKGVSFQTKDVQVFIGEQDRQCMAAKQKFIAIYGQEALVKQELLVTHRFTLCKILPKVTLKNGKLKVAA